MGTHTLSHIDEIETPPVLYRTELMLIVMSEVITPMRVRHLARN